MKELMYIKSCSKRRLPVIVGTLLLVIIGSVWLNTVPFRSDFEIADELGGNIFSFQHPFGGDYRRSGHRAGGFHVRGQSEVMYCCPHPVKECL